jgi:hypothetical protein
MSRARWAAYVSFCVGAAALGVGVFKLLDVLFPSDDGTGFGRDDAVTTWLVLVVLFGTMRWWDPVERALRRFFGTEERRRQRKENSPSGDQGPPR